MKVPRLLFILSLISLPILVVVFWEPIKSGAPEGLMVISANICVSVLLFVYLLDRS